MDWLASVPARAASEWKLAGRSLVRSPGLVAATVATLSLGIGTVTAAYSFVDGILLSPLAYRGADRLMVIRLVIPELNQFPFWNANARSVDAWRRACGTACSELKALGVASAVVTGDDSAERLNGARVVPGFSSCSGSSRFSAACSDPKTEKPYAPESSC